MGIISNLLNADTASMEVGTGTWTAGANTTIARTTASSLVGAASLRLTSTAAGAMSASTATVAVSPSTTYMGFGFGANLTSTSGRVLSIRIDWYTAGDVFISSSTTTSTWSLAANTNWSNTILSVATSPGTAAKAALTVMVTAGITAGGQQIVFDSLGLGLPAALAGNVLPYLTESVEMDSSGWSATTNCSVARAGGAFEGSYCLGLTSTASGSTTATTAARAPVTTGVEYEVSTRVACPAAGRTLVFEARWYSASVGGSPISTSSRTVTTQDPANWERWTFIATAPALATHVEMRLRPTAVGAAEAWYFDQMAVRPTSAALVAGNVLPYSVQSIEVDASGWTAGTNATISQSVPADPVLLGGRSLKVVATAAGEARVQAAALAPVTAGLYYKATQWHYGVGSHQVWTDIDWYASDGTTYLGRAFPDQDVAAAGGLWRSNYVGRLAPAGAAFARVVSLFQAATPGQVVFLDSISLVQTDPPYILTVVPETASVTLQLSGLTHPGTITLSRVHPDGSRHPVRAMGGDAVALATTGTTMIFEDYEAPLGVTFRYEYSSGTSSVVTTDVTVPFPDEPYMTWLKDPGQPARNVLLMTKSTGTDSRKVERGVYPIRGSRRSVVISDVRKDPENVLTVYTRTDEERAALDWILDTGAVLLIQGRPVGHLYVSIGDTAAEPVDGDGSDPWRQWPLPYMVLERPVGGMAGTAGRTWQDVLDDYDTWQDVLDSYDTWLGVLTGMEGT